MTKFLDTFEITRAETTVPESWVPFDPTQTVEVWEFRSQDIQFTELEPFTAETDEVCLWGEVNKLGYLPIADIFRCGNWVVWLIRHQMVDPRFPSERCGLQLVIDGDVYNRQIGVGDFHNLPEAPQPGIHWWLIGLDIDWGEYICQHSNFTDESVEAFVHAVRDWWSQQFVNELEVVNDNFEEHELLDVQSGDEIWLDFLNGSATVRVCTETESLRFVDNPDFPFAVRCELLARAIRQLRRADGCW